MASLFVRERVVEWIYQQCNESFQEQQEHQLALQEQQQRLEKQHHPRLHHHPSYRSRYCNCQRFSMIWILIAVQCIAGYSTRRQLLRHSIQKMQTTSKVFSSRISAQPAMFFARDRTVTVVSCSIPPQQQPQPSTDFFRNLMFSSNSSNVYYPQRKLGSFSDAKSDKQMVTKTGLESETVAKEPSFNNSNDNNSMDEPFDSTLSEKIEQQQQRQQLGKAKRRQKNSRHLDYILERNRVWAERINIEDPDFLRLLTEPQQPKYLYIGCSDSRVSPSAVLDARPGEVFVHRNIGNLAVEDDLSVLSVLEFAIVYLGVQDIIVAGHYGCGAIQAASTDKDYGVLERWLRQIRSTRRLHKRTLESLPLGNPRLKALTEMNVVEQCINVYKSAVVQRKRAQVEQELLKLHQTEKLSDDQSSEIYPRIHGVVFDPETGCLKEIESDLQLSTQEQQPPPPPEEQAQQHAGRGRD